MSKPFAAKALKWIEEEAHEAGYQVIVGNNEMSFAKEKEYVEHMLLDALMHGCEAACSPCLGCYSSCLLLLVKK